MRGDLQQNKVKAVKSDKMIARAREDFFGRIVFVIWLLLSLCVANFLRTGRSLAEMRESDDVDDNNGLSQ